MTFPLAVIAIYVSLYVLSLTVAVWQRKTFPLGDSIPVILIVGFGFTGLVYWIVPQHVEVPARPSIETGELLFTIIYLICISAFLVQGMPVPAPWKGHFLKEKLAVLGFKLLLFVLVPLAVLRIFWRVGWAELGFSAGDIPGQLLSAVLLILIIGGFNLLAGGGAEPLRKRHYSLRHTVFGLILAFAWNTLEVGLVEEFFFRAFLQGRIIGILDSPIAAISIASLLFGLAHVPGIYLRRGDKHGPLGEHPSLLNSILYGILTLSPTGWFTGLLYLRTQSLLAPILVHAAVDAVAHTSEFLEGLGIRKQTPG